MRRTAAVAIVLALAGCAGKPTTYLTLSPVPPAHQAAPSRITALSIANIGIPPAIDRLHLTTVAGAGELHVAGDTEWAGPLGPMARIVLAQDMAARLTGVDVLMPGDPEPPGGAAVLRVNIQSFAPDAAGTVRLQADWSVTPPGGGAALAAGSVAPSEAGAPAPGAEAQSMSKALGALADAVAARL